jgi:hypothetical protein
MDGLVDPSADVLWDSVAYIATTTKVEDRRPRTDEEWKAVRNSAITLIEAGNLLTMPGRVVATAHDSAATDAPAGAVVAVTEAGAEAGAGAGAGELSHAQIQQRIDSTHDSFNQFARNLQNAGLKALAAIDARNADALMDAGGTIDEACEACHVTYWYPNQSRAGR